MGHGPWATRHSLRIHKKKTFEIKALFLKYLLLTHETHSAI